MSAPFIRTQFNYDRDKASNDTGLECKDKSLTQQQFKDDTDINVLFGRYLETGEFPQVEHQMSYGNFEGIYDFQSAMNVVRAAQEAFATLPARIKNRFNNDPQHLLEFINDPENREEAIFLKLVKADPPAQPALQTEPTGRPQPTPQEATTESDNQGGTGTITATQ